MHVLSKAQLRAAVDALFGAGALYDTVKIGLFTNDVPITDHLVLADLTPATFTGYTISGAITWPAAFTNDSGDAEVDSPLQIKTCTTAPLAPETVYGLYVVDNAAAVLRWIAKFSSPQVIQDVGDAVVYVARFALGNEAVDLEPILS